MREIFFRHAISSVYKFDNSQRAAIAGRQVVRNSGSYTYIKRLTTDACYYTAMFYTSDVHGNVDNLFQDYKSIAVIDSDPFKLIFYDYDLIKR